MDDLKTKYLDQIATASDEAALEDIRVTALGKKGEISLKMRELGKMSPEERQVAGPALNALKDEITSALAAKKAGQADAALLGARGEKFTKSLGHVFQAEGFMLKFEPSGFDLGEIENVIDQAQQGMAGPAHRLNIICLLRRQGGLAQKGGDANAAIHGRADLMADVSNKRGFQLARLGRCV